MRTFQLDPKMLTMSGTFYPNGYMVLMFPSEQAARDAAKVLGHTDFDIDDFMLIRPEDIRDQLMGTSGPGDDAILPSAGTEADTVRRYWELAQDGHFGLMVPSPHNADAERAMEALKDHKPSYGQRYRTLIIEDLVE